MSIGAPNSRDDDWDPNRTEPNQVSESFSKLPTTRPLPISHRADLKPPEFSRRKFVRLQIGIPVRRISFICDFNSGGTSTEAGTATAKSQRFDRFNQKPLYMEPTWCSRRQSS